MAIPISASFGPDAVSEVIALTGGNPQRMAQLGVSRPEFRPAITVLHLIKQAGVPPMPTKSLTDEAMNPPPPQNPGATGLGAVNVPKGPPMGQMPGRPLMQMAAVGPSGNQTTPPPQPMPQMAGGGLLALDNSAFDEQSFSGGGIVAFAGGRDVNAKAERRRALMAALSNSDYANQHELIRRELRALDGVTPLKGLRELPGFVSPEEANPMPQFDRGKMEDLRGFTTPEEVQRRQLPQGGGLPGFLSPEEANPMPQFNRGRMKDLPGFLTPKEANPMPKFDRGKMEDLRGFTTPEEVQRRQLPQIGSLPGFLTPKEANPMPKFGVQPPAPAFSLNSYQPEKTYDLEAALNQRVPSSKGLNAIAPGAKNPPSLGPKAALPTRKSDTPFIDTALRTSRTPPGVKDNPDQTDETLDSILAKRKGYMGPDVNYKGTSAEDKDARRQEDLWSMLAQIGFNTMAGTSQFGLENVGKGAAAAMPAMQEAMKNRRADDREDRKLEFESLLSQRKERGEGFDSSMREFGRLDDKKQALRIAEMNNDTNNRQIDSSAANARLMANKQTDQGQLLEMMQSGDPKQVAAATEYQKNRNMIGDRSRIQVAAIKENVVAKVDAVFGKPISRAQDAYARDPSEANKLAVQKLAKDRKDRIDTNLKLVLANLPPEYLEAGDGVTPAPKTVSLTDMKN